MRVILLSLPLLLLYNKRNSRVDSPSLAGPRGIER